jgi:HD-GYP domain-containing protein (c-di-GMP phosphodiesterase class II)
MSTVVLKDKEGKPYALAGIARDISERKRAEKALEVSNEKLRKTIHGIIQALAMTVESRDLYTSGHQKRVSDLACAIAADGFRWTRSKLSMAGLFMILGRYLFPLKFQQTGPAIRT